MAGLTKSMADRIGATARASEKARMQRLLQGPAPQGLQPTQRVPPVGPIHPLILGEAVADEIDKLKAVQDKLAGIKRRKA